MRETRTSSSEGGGGESTVSPYPYRASVIPTDFPHKSNDG